MDPFLLGRSGDGLGFDQNRASTFFGPNMREGLDTVRQKGDPACPVGLPALANVSIPLKGRIKMLKGIRRLFANPGIETRSSGDNEPVFGQSSRRLTAVPPLPYSCKIPSFTNRKVSYDVEVSKEGFWSCSCLDYIKNSSNSTTRSYYCKHCESVSHITGIPCPKNKWRAKFSGRMLTGEILEEGMEVYGYLTTRELYDDFTNAQIKQFLGEPDEVALFDDGGGCKLYLGDRVDEVRASPEYQHARERYFALAETRKAAAIKAKATRERKERERQERRALERAAFKGVVYVAKIQYKYGWEKWGVLAEDKASATKLFEELITSPEMKEIEKENFDDARDEHKESLKDYREAYREMVHGSGFRELVEPIKPLRKEFVFQLTEVAEADVDKESFEINEVQPVDSGGGWEHNLYNAAS